MLPPAFTIRAQLTKAGHARLQEVLRLNCGLYNQALAARKTAGTESAESISLHEQIKDLTVLHQAEQRWRDLSVQISRGTLRRRDRACQSFCRRIRAGARPGPPQFPEPQTLAHPGRGTAGAGPGPSRGP